MEKIKNLISGLKDPRIERNKLHSLQDIVLLTLIASICGCESWETIEEFGKSKIDTLKQYLDLTHGIPSHDTIERLFKRLDSKAFSNILVQMGSALGSKKEGNILNIDGKTICGSKDSTMDKYAIHLVSAWCNTNRLVLGQVKTECKTNEIEAVKSLLDMLDIEGAVITADAMSCQKEIVQQITGKKADYMIAIKDNQKNFKADIEFEFNTQTQIPTHQTVEKNHGRIETRTCEVIQNLDQLQGRESWAELKSIIKIHSVREIKGIVNTEERYYISSKLETPEYFNKVVRGHWAIENSLHWVLDVQFNEDKNRKRKDNAAENMALVRRLALNKLANNPYKRQGINNRRLIASWNNDYLTQILKN